MYMLCVTLCSSYLVTLLTMHYQGHTLVYV